MPDGVDLSDVSFSLRVRVGARTDLQASPDHIQGVGHRLSGCPCNCSTRQPCEHAELSLIVQF